jgi:hypothetical protein
MTDAYRHLLEGHEAEAAERFEDLPSSGRLARTLARRAAEVHSQAVEALLPKLMVAGSIPVVRSR